MLSKHLPQFINSPEFARSLDEKDPLKGYRDRFYIPQIDDKDSIYFCGNSLGLQPKTVRSFIEQELLDWQNLGVKGHHESLYPWFFYHHFLEQSTARLVGANPLEVVVMNTLTVNLNLLMISFYRPEKNRYKIMMEEKAFPSDQNAVENQVKFHAKYQGFNPLDAVIELSPREGEYCLRTEDILQKIEEHKNDLALVMLGGVNYYSGQAFDMKTIAAAAKKAGACVGYDLAHAAGNIELSLHDWDVDFATWCSYKYLNSGPGGTSGVFINEKHCYDNNIPRLSGWWGTDEKTRFDMMKGFYPQPGAAGWQMSNAQILPMAAHRASLEIFDEVGMKKLREKSLLLTGYLEFLLKNPVAQNRIGTFQIITPENPDERGCQLSLLMGNDGKEIFDKLTNAGVVADWREPNVFRIAPVPLYNTFEDAWHFAELFHGG